MGFGAQHSHVLKPSAYRTRGSEVGSLATFVLSRVYVSSIRMSLWTVFLKYPHILGSLAPLVQYLHEHRNSHVTAQPIKKSSSKADTTVHSKAGFAGDYR